MSTILEGITVDKLQEMLDNSIRKALTVQHLPNNDKPLNSAETCKLLGISSPTLQKMRNNKTIPFKKIDNKLFYNRSDVLNAVSK